MRYNPLHGTDIKISELGFGAWGIGGISDGMTSYGTTNDTTSLQALHCAFDHGITFFDTANVYGDGHSETLIGQAFKGQRQHIVIATKLGLHKFNQPLPLTFLAMQESLNNSLKRLQTDYVDILLLHAVSLEQIRQNPAIIEHLQYFEKQGKIRHFGISVTAPHEAFTALNTHHINTTQGNLNLLDMRFLEACNHTNQHINAINYIARTPYCFGFLAEDYTLNTPFPKGDHRNAWPAAQITTWVKASHDMLTAMGCTNLHDTDERCKKALNFCLSSPHVASVIPGMMDKQQVMRNIHALAEKRLKSHEIHDIMQIYQQINRQYNGIFKKG